MKAARTLKGRLRVLEERFGETSAQRQLELYSRSIDGDQGAIEEFERIIVSMSLYRNMRLPDSPSVTIPVGSSLQDAEKMMIEATLRHTDGNIAAAAKLLRIDRSTLYKKIKQSRIARWTD